MPFDGSGNFTPLGPPYFPEVSGTTVSSTYFNALMNDLFTGMSTTLCRDGQSTVSGNFNWNNHNLTGVAALSCTTLTVNGSPVVIGNYLPLAGGTMTGDLLMTDAAMRITSTASVPSIYLTQNGAGSSRIRYAYTGQAGALFALRDETAGVDRLSINAAGEVTLSSNAYVTGNTFFKADTLFYASKTGSNPVINFDTNDFFSYDRAANSFVFQVGGVNYAVLSSTTLSLSAGISTQTGITIASGGLTVTSGGVTVSAGGLNVTGSAAFNSGVTIASSLTVSSGGILITGNSSVTGTFNVTGTLSQAGNAVWHAGNLTPSNYAPLAGANFTGSVTFGDTNFIVSIVSSKPRITFDTGDYVEYDRTTNKLYFVGGGVQVASLNLSNGNILTKGTIGASQASV